MNNTHKSKGFTLIELLVVVAIIGILATVVLASLEGARSKARDAKRLSDLKQIQIALEMYYGDNGSYPNNGGGWWGNCSTFGSRGVTGPTGYIPNLAPNYISVLPLDPKPSNGACYLYRSSDPNSYMFLIYQTVEGVVPDSLKRPNYPNEKNYAVYAGNGSSY